MPLYFFFLVLLTALLSSASAAPQTPLKRHTATTLVQVVNPAPVALQWTPPAAIPVGVALGPTQLSAKANTPGAFAYTPPAGTLLKPGDYLLSVVFTPASSNFAITAATAPITVEGPGDSTFVVNWPPTVSPLKPIYVNADGLASITLTVVPIGNFQQPVSFACSGPGEITCIFNPVTVRPTTTQVQVNLTIKYTPPAEISRVQPDRSLERHAFPVLALTALALLALPARLRLSSRCRRGLDSLIVFVGYLLLSAMAACGGGRMPGKVVVENLTESSVVESKTIPLTIVLPPSGNLVPSAPPPHPRISRASPRTTS
jgi:hypothetical protein